MKKIVKGPHGGLHGGSPLSGGLPAGRSEGKGQKKKDLPRLDEKSGHIPGKPIDLGQIDPSQNHHSQKDGSGPPEDPLLPGQESPQGSQNKNGPGQSPPSLHKALPQSPLFPRKSSRQNAGRHRKKGPGENRSQKEGEKAGVSQEDPRSFGQDKKDQGQDSEDSLPGILSDPTLFFGGDRSIGTLQGIGHSVEVDPTGEGHPCPQKKQGLDLRGNDGKKTMERPGEKRQKKAQEKPGRKKGGGTDAKRKSPAVDEPGNGKPSEEGQPQKKPRHPFPDPCPFPFGCGGGHPGPASETEASEKVAIRL